MWSLKKSVLFMFSVGIFVTIQCESNETEPHFVFVHGYTVENPSKFIKVILFWNSTLKEDERSRSMINITHVTDLKTLHFGFVADLPYLEEFKIFDVTQIEPGSFKNVPKLSQIVIRSPSLKDIKEGIFNHLNVVVLDLSSVKLETIASGAFDDMPKLEKLNLRDNLLTRYNSEWFRNTQTLKFVDLSKNEIEELPREVFKNLVHPEIKINLTDNSVSKIGDKLFSTKKIGGLSLKSNSLDDFGEHVLDGVEEMQVLDISHNRIECLSGNLSRIFVAKNIFIKGNRFGCNCGDSIIYWHILNRKSHYVDLQVMIPLSSPCHRYY